MIAIYREGPMASTSPTTDNGRTIAGMYEAFGRGDVPHVLAQMAPDVEWIETEAESIPAHGTFASPQEVLESVLAKVPEYFEQFELHPELWVEAGDDVVVTGRVVARTRTGRKLDAPYAHVFTFRDGKVCRNDNFHDTALWVAALS
jgi:ketosteroid isomerase-like protein